MTVIVESKEMKVTSGLRAHVETQARKLMKLSKKITKITVHMETIRKKSNDHLANVVTYCVELPGKDVVVKKSAKDMYQAIVQATEGAVRQVRKRYERRRDLRRHVRKESLVTPLDFAG